MLGNYIREFRELLHKKGVNYVVRFGLNINENSGMDGSLKFCMIGVVNCDEIGGVYVVAHGEVYGDINGDFHGDVNVDVKGGKWMWLALWRAL